MIDRKLGLAAAAIAMLVAEVGCRSTAVEQPNPTRPPGEAWLTTTQMEDSKIVVEVATERKFERFIAVGGKVTFDDLFVTHVFSPVSGRVMRVLAQPGQRVKKGAPLVRISSPDVGNVFSDVQKARADLEATERDFKRQQELYNAHASSQKDYEASIGAYRKAKAELERAEQKARLLRTGDLDSITQEFTLRAPIEGGVIARNVNPGIEVQGLYSGGTAVELFTIGELDRVWIMADVPEMDVARVHRGARVKATVLSYPEKEFEGEIDWVADVLDPSMRTAKVRCIIPNPHHLLKPEMYAKVSISSSVAQVLAIPRSAILRLGDQSVVFVARGQSPDGKLRFERRPVKADEQETGGYVPIREGLKSGETIVTDGAIILSGMT